ncbi:MAG TPA: hypothetical protein VJ965_12510 [Anaerolineales bacterium]|nr:hypothetical protein [Anaerolineales bacterium]
MQTPTQKFTRSDLFKLFLVCAFPLHLWTILMMMRDVNWVAERSTMWDAVGFSGYALLYTLAESVILFGFILLLSLLVPRQWNKTLRFTVLSLLAFVLAGWSIMEQLILIVFWTPLRRLAERAPFLLSADWVPLAILTVLVAITVAVPLFLLHERGKLQETVYLILDRLTMLSGLYLFLDALALVLVILRNVS